MCFLLKHLIARLHKPLNCKTKTASAAVDQTLRCLWAAINRFSNSINCSGELFTVPPIPPPHVTRFDSLAAILHAIWPLSRTFFAAVVGCALTDSHSWMEIEKKKSFMEINSIVLLIFYPSPHIAHPFRKYFMITKRLLKLFSINFIKRLGSTQLSLRGKNNSNSWMNCGISWEGNLKWWKRRKVGNWKTDNGRHRKNVIGVSFLGGTE